MLMDVMGLHLPGAAFVHPDDPLRDALTDATTRRVAQIAASERPYGIGQVVDEKSVINGVVALLEQHPLPVEQTDLPVDPGTVGVVTRDGKEQS